MSKARAYEMTVQVADGTYDFTTDNNNENLHELTATFSATPTAGTISISARPRGSQDFFAIQGATDMDATEPIFAAFSGNVEEYRVTTLNIVGAGGSFALFDLASDGVPERWYGALSDSYDPSTGGLIVTTAGNGHLCLDNTTDTPLLAGAFFEGPFEDTLNFNTITIGIKADQDSATDGLVVQWSADGITVTQTDEFSIIANKGKVFTFSPANRYVSVKYTNGIVDQGSFNLQTIFKKGGFKASSHRIQDSIVADDDAELVKAVLSAQIANDGFVNIGATESGNLKTTDAENGLAIAKGEVVGTSFVHKFGNAPDFDTGDLEVTVWDGAEDGEAWELMNYVYSSTNDINSVSSSSASDTLEVTIEGLDVNYNEVIQTATLAGQVRVALVTPLLRVYRAYNSNSVGLVGHVFVFVNGALTGGVPNTNADIRAIIDPVNQQTEMAVYTIPAGKTGYMRDWYASTAGANRDSNYPVKLISRDFGGVFRVKHVSAISDNGTSAYQHNYNEPEIFTEKTDIEMRTQVTAAGITAASFSAGFDIVIVDD